MHGALRTRCRWLGGHRQAKKKKTLGIERGGGEHTTYMTGVKKTRNWEKVGGEAGEGRQENAGVWKLNRFREEISKLLDKKNMSRNQNMRRKKELPPSRERREKKKKEKKGPKPGLGACLGTASRQPKKKIDKRRNRVRIGTRAGGELIKKRWPNVGGKTTKNGHKKQGNEAKKSQRDMTRRTRGDPQGGAED